LSLLILDGDFLLVLVDDLEFDAPTLKLIGASKTGGPAE
jgi:hypothetical protein